MHVVRGSLEPKIWKEIVAKVCKLEIIEFTRQGRQFRPYYPWIEDDGHFKILSPNIKRSGNILLHRRKLFFIFAGTPSDEIHPASGTTQNSLCKY